MKKLDKRFKDRWIAALRSGKFTQARGELTGSDAMGTICSHCCIAVGASLRRNCAALRAGKSIFDHDYDTDDAAEECGLDEPTTRKLVEFNDGKKWSFRKIATWIEKNL